MWQHGYGYSSDRSASAQGANMSSESERSSTLWLVARHRTSVITLSTEKHENRHV